MRLIDADELPRHGGRSGIVHWSDIEKAPIIDSIPKSFICKRIVDLQVKRNELDEDSAWNLYDRIDTEIWILVALMEEWDEQTRR